MSLQTDLRYTASTWSEGAGTTSGMLARSSSSMSLLRASRARVSSPSATTSLPPLEPIPERSNLFSSLPGTSPCSLISFAIMFRPMSSRSFWTSATACMAVLSGTCSDASPLGTILNSKGCIGTWMEGERTYHLGMLSSCVRVPYRD